jgi:hypothetical protein
MTTQPTFAPTYEDLRCAGIIIACQGRADRFGNPLYTAEFIAWAKDVFRAFARAAWALVRSTGRTLKAAWATLKAQATCAVARITAIIAPEGVTGRQLVRATKAGRELQGRDTATGQVIRVTGKGAFRARTRVRVDAIQTTLPKAEKAPAKPMGRLLGAAGSVLAYLYSAGAQVIVVAGPALHFNTGTFTSVKAAKAYAEGFAKGTWTL